MINASLFDIYDPIHIIEERDIWMVQFSQTGQGDKWTVQELVCLLLPSPSSEKPSTYETFKIGHQRRGVQLRLKYELLSKDYWKKEEHCVKTHPIKIRILAQKQWIFVEGLGDLFSVYL